MSARVETALQVGPGARPRDSVRRRAASHPGRGPRAGREPRTARGSTIDRRGPREMGHPRACPRAGPRSVHAEALGRRSIRCFSAERPQGSRGRGPPKGVPHPRTTGARFAPEGGGGQLDREGFSEGLKPPTAPWARSAAIRLRTGRPRAVARGRSGDRPLGLLPELHLLEYCRGEDEQSDREGDEDDRGRRRGDIRRVFRERSLGDHAFQDRPKIVDDTQ